MKDEKKYSVLVVDDEKSNILALTNILKPDYTVYAVKDGESAIEAAAAYMPDIILLDIIMPGMDGFEAIERLKKNPKTKNIPVIFVTGLNSSGDEEKGLALGTADYITKPFSPAIVKIRVKNQIKLLEQFRSNEYDIIKYKLANDALNIGLWDMDVVGTDYINTDSVFSWSKEFINMIGFENEHEFPNVLHSWSDRLHPEDKERTLNAFNAHLKDTSGKTPYNIEYRLMVKNGEYRNFQALGTSLRDSNGIPLRVAGALMDITEKRKMEVGIADAMEQIKESAHWYKAILDAIPMPVKVTDKDKRVKFINKATEEYFNLKNEDVQLKYCNEVFGTYICNSENCCHTRASKGEKRTYYEKGDRSHQIDVEYLYTRDGEYAGYIEVMQDITKVKQLAKQSAEAEMTSRAKSAFLANMSHEMRTPMNVIVGLTNLMLEEEDPSLNLKENLNKINTAGNTLLGLISDVLDISKIEAGKLDLVPVEYELSSLLNDVILLNMIRIAEKPIVFNLDINEHLLNKLFGDDLRVRQIINNLLSNAFKYTQKGTVVLGVNTERYDNDVWLNIYVSDSGIGIREEDLSKLFKDYGQVDANTNRLIEGTGLGLSITKRLTEMMSGEISAQSEYGKGSTFCVRIKQLFVSDQVIGHDLAENMKSFNYTEHKNEADKNKLVRQDLSYARVLVVDDMKTNLDVAAKILGKYNMKVDCVTSGHEAIEKIRAEDPVYNAIFMDHMMPIMDGMEAAYKIRSLDTDYAKNIPIIALTANAIQGMKELFYSNGFQGFISKPINMKQMDEIVKKWVANQ